MVINFCKKVGLTPDRPARTGVVTAENRHPKALDSHLLVQWSDANLIQQIQTPYKDTAPKVSIVGDR